MATPITKAYNADGELVHDCAEAGCQVSWDGYVLAEGFVSLAPNPENPGEPIETPLAVGDRVPGAQDPGPEWDTREPGIARQRPA